MTIEWFMPKATAEQKERAQEAALAVFAEFRIQPEIAAVAVREMQLYRSRRERGPLPHPDSPRAELVFMRAQTSAALAAHAAGLADEFLRDGYIRVDFTDDSRAAYYQRESRVLNWVDPDAPAAVN